MEIFKDIKGYEGCYQVSNYGRIKSLNRVVLRKNSKPMTIKERILSPRNGRYLNIKLRNKNEEKTFNVHFLVAQQFLNHEPKQGFVIDHIDKNEKNNHLNNLRVITHKENIMRSMKEEFKKKQSIIASKRKRKQGKFL